MKTNSTAPSNTIGQTHPDELVIPPELAGDLPPIGDITQIFDAVPENIQQPQAPAPITNNLGQLEGVIGGLLAQGANNFTNRVTQSSGKGKSPHQR